MFFSRFISPIQLLFTYLRLEFIFYGKLGFTLSTLFLGAQFALVWGGLMWVFYWSINPIEVCSQILLSSVVGAGTGAWMTYCNIKYPDTNSHSF